MEDKVRELKQRSFDTLSSCSNVLLNIRVIILSKTKSITKPLSSSTNWIYWFRI